MQSVIIIIIKSYTTLDVGLRSYLVMHLGLDMYIFTLFIHIDFGLETN